MAHLPPGLGIPDGPLSFDHSMSIFTVMLLIELGSLLLLALLLRWSSQRHTHLAGAEAGRVRPRHPTRRTSRPAPHRLRLVTRGRSA